MSLLMRLMLVKRCFCFFFVIEREIKWEKEGTVSEEKLFPTDKW